MHEQNHCDNHEESKGSPPVYAGTPMRRAHALANDEIIKSSRGWE
jgi:hypothetical protein